MQLRLKIESNYQPSPQKKVKEKRRGGEFIRSDCTLKKKKSGSKTESVQKMRRSFCVKR